jgi:hypothetical protein
VEEEEDQRRQKAPDAKVGHARGFGVWSGLRNPNPGIPVTGDGLWCFFLFFMVCVPVRPSSVVLTDRRSGGNGVRAGTANRGSEAADVRRPIFFIWPAACRGIFTVQLGCPAWNALVAREGRTVKKGGKNVAAYSSRRIFDCDPHLTNHHKNMILLPVSYTRSLLNL